ncbi:MAG: flagellar hook-length control protein FliK [Gammaproteobacteria bacterium]|nr:flagellar hook-length control protein FliK [Gammaproteobacteria bacterium]
MSDSLNNMLMNLGSSVNFSNGNAASFADVATDLIQSNELTTTGDADNIRFIDLFRGEVKSFLAQTKADVNANDQEITTEQLDNLVEQLIEQLKQGDSKSNTADVDLRKGIVNGEPLDKAPKVTPEEQKIFITIIRQWEAELKPSINDQPTAQAPVTTSQESEQPVAPALTTAPLTDQQLDLIEYVANASPQELAQLAELSHLSPQQMIDVVSKVEAKATEEDRTIVAQPINQQSAITTTELLSKLEQMVATQPPNQAMVASLEKIKQLVEQPPKTINFEKMIEQRVQQPIEQLINQSHQPKLLLTDDINAVANKEQLTQEVKKLISLLPNKDQKELVALINIEDDNAGDTEVKQQNQPIDRIDKINPQSTIVSDAKSSAQVQAQARESMIDDNDVPQTVKANDNFDKMVKQVAMASVSSDTNDLKKVTLESVDPDDPQSLEKLAAADVKPKGQPLDNFDKMIRQMGWVSANNEQSQERSILARQQADSDSSSALSQASERTDITSVKEAQVQNQVKAEAAQLAQRLPLHQETPAAKMLKERLTMMANGNIQQAVIQLDPEELGGMSIKLQIHNDQMNIQFVVQNPQAKELLENAMGKLREMLEQQGIALNEADVRQNDQRQNQQSSESQDSLTDSIDQLATDQEAIVLTLTKQSTDGIDYYA